MQLKKAGEIVEEVKVLAAKPTNWVQSLGSSWGGKNQLLKDVLWPLHTPWQACAHTHKRNSKNILLETDVFFKICPFMAALYYKSFYFILFITKSAQNWITWPFLLLSCPPPWLNHLAASIILEQQLGSACSSLRTSFFVVLVFFQKVGLVCPL